MKSKPDTKINYNAFVNNSESNSGRDMRSEKIQKLLHQRPHPLLMWGNVILLIIFIGIAIYLLLNEYLTFDKLLKLE